MELLFITPTVVGVYRWWVYFVVGERSHTLKHVEAKCESSIKIMYRNARGVLPKIDALHAVVSCSGGT